MFVNQSPQAQRYTLARWNEARQNRNLPRVFPPRKFVDLYNSLNINRDVNSITNDHVTHKPRLGASSDYISYEDAFPNNRPLRISADSSTPASTTASTQSSSTITSMVMETRGNKRVNEDVGGSDLSRRRGGDSMEVGGSDGHSIHEAPISEAPGQSGHNAASDGGFDSAQGPKSYLKHCGYSYEEGYRTYEKSHRYKSWALPFQFQAADGDNKHVTGPLAYIPVDSIKSYMSPREFALIPAGSHVVECSATIELLNSSTSFQTGGSDPDIATAQHVRTGLLGIDLTKKLRGGGVAAYNIQTGMKATIKSDSYNSADFVKYQYGSWQLNSDATNPWDTSELPGCAYGIPYVNDNYFTIFNISDAGATAAGFTEETSLGHEYVTSYLTEFNLNDKLWDEIVHYKYKFRHAPIGTPFPPAELYNTDFNNQTGHDTRFSNRRVVSGISADGTNTYANQFVSTTTGNVSLVEYDDNAIEKGGINRIGSAMTEPARQPTLFFGMRGIGKITADLDSRRAEVWVDAAVEYIVHFRMVIKLPASPNRFTQPGRLNVQMENAVTGTTAKSDGSNNLSTFRRVVTYNLKHS